MLRQRRNCELTEELLLQAPPAPQAALNSRVTSPYICSPRPSRSRDGKESVGLGLVGGEARMGPSSIPRTVRLLPDAMF